MKKLGVRLGSVGVLAALVVALTYLTATASVVKLTITVNSAYLRSGPSLLQPRVTSVFKGQSYPVIGRTADNAWVQLEVAGSPTQTWTLAAVGILTGDVNSVPVTSGSALPAATPISSAPVPAGGLTAAIPASGAALPAAAPVPGAFFTVTAKSANLRASPSAQSGKVGALYSGQKVAVLGRTTDVQWMQVNGDGVVGWVIASAGTLNLPTGMLPVTDQALPAPTATSPAGAAPTAAPGVTATVSSGAAAVPGALFSVTVKSVNVRSGPSAVTDKVGALYSGQTAPVAGRSTDAQWLQVTVDGLTGWVIASTGTLNLPLGMLPVADKPQPTVPAPVPTGATPTSTTAAVSEAAFTVTAQNVNLRANTTSASIKLGSLALGQTVPAVGRSTDGLWTQVASDGIVGWVIASAGKLNVPAEAIPITDRPQPIVPVTPTDPPPPRSPEANLLPAWLPAITPNMRRIYLSYRLGKNPNMFTVAGDCNSDDPDYLVRLLAGRFDLTGYLDLNGVVGQFAGGIARHSLATHGGLSASTMFDTAWANPTYCRKSMGNAEGPLPCELRVSQASIVFFAVGTGDHPQWKSFEANYRQMIEFALKDQVLPVLVTKADDIEALVDGAPSGYINNVIRKLAAEYGVPLMDFEQATHDLPNHGLLKEDLPFHLSPAGFDMRTLFMLKMLELISGK